MKILNCDDLIFDYLRVKANIVEFLIEYDVSMTPSWRSVVNYQLHDCS
jgi:hypothetical protein